MFFLIKHSILEDIDTLAFAKRASASQYQHFSLRSLGHHAGHKNAKGVDPVRDCQKQTEEFNVGETPTFKPRLATILKQYQRQKCWVLFKSYGALADVLSTA